MKKFVLLMLILGLATSAQAGLIFTVNGEPQPDEITLDWTGQLYPSEVEIDLELSDGSNIFSYTLDYVLTNPQAMFIWDNIAFPQVFDFAGKTSVAESQNGQITAGQFLNPAVEGPTVLMNNLFIQCLEPTDVVLEIYAAAGTVIDGENIPAGTLLHTLSITQVPEPMTLTLLGLGGLFLVRRKK